MKQLSITGTESPRNEAVESVLDRMRAADEARKRATEELNGLRATLAQLMLDGELASYDYVDDEGRQWAVVLKVPDLPGVQVKFIGVREE